MLKETIEFSAGLTVKACSASIAFLWDNWEVLYQLYPEKISTERLTEVAWHATGFMAKAEFHLSKRVATVISGHYEFYTLAKFLGSPRFRAKTIMEYRRLDNHKISYSGTTSMIVPQILRPANWLLRLMADLAGFHVNKIGGQAVEAITARPDIVREKAGLNMYHLYEEYLEEEGILRRACDSLGDSRHFDHFDKNDHSATQAIASDISLLECKLKELEQKLNSLIGRFDTNDFHVALLIFNSDPKMALIKNSAIIERMARIVFEREFQEASKSYDLKGVLAKLNDKSDVLPPSIAAFMRIVVELGKVGGLVTSIRDVGSRIDTTEFSISFNSTLRVTEWFFCEYLTPRRSDYSDFD